MAYRKLSSAVRAGSRLDQLKVLAKILAKQIDNCESQRDLAGLSKQYRDTLREIEEIQGVDNDDEISEILSKRDSDGKPGAVR